MTVERIVIDVDDTELDFAIAHANKALYGSTQATTSVKTLGSLWGTTKDELKDIPTIDREARLIITKIPLMRDALGMFYRFKMLAGGSLELGALILIIYALQTILSMQREAEKKAKEYESLIRGYRRFTTHAEFLAWQEEDKRLSEQYRSQSP